MDMKASKGMY